MAHARQQIREAVQTRLAGLSLTGSNVFASRVYPHDDAHMPSLAIYSLEESVRSVDDAEFRDLQIVVEARAKAATDIDDTLDQICADVETALYGDQTLGGLKVKALQLQGTAIELTGDLDKPAGVARMQWAVLYRVNAAAPQTLID